MTPRRKLRIRVEAIAGALAGALAVLTIVVPDWIEEIFGIDPDHGNGSVEWLVVGVLLATALVLAGVVRHELRAAQTS